MEENIVKNFQLSLFYDFQVFIKSSNFYRKYYLLFKSLPLTNITDRNYGTGRTGYSHHAAPKSPEIRPFLRKRIVSSKEWNSILHAWVTVRQSKQHITS
jgi:hypothetical protein